MQPLCSFARPLLLVVSIFFAFISFCQVSYAEDNRLSMYLLLESWGDETTPGHVAVMARWDKRLGSGSSSCSRIQHGNSKFRN